MFIIISEHIARVGYILSEPLSQCIFTEKGGAASQSFWYKAGGGGEPEPSFKQIQ